MSQKEHWEEVYINKESSPVGWTQEIPEPSLGYIQKIAIDKATPIIDIGGGDSFLVDHLIQLGYSDITVLDISEAAIDRAKKRLGESTAMVDWKCMDIVDFEPIRTYGIWHDRACFHFLLEPAEIAGYMDLVRQWASDGVVIGTFSDQGPPKCSGLEITQYSIADLQALLTPTFEMIDSMNYDHITPTGNKQNYSFCSFKKVNPLEDLLI